MKEVLVIHTGINNGGGGEQVCFNVLESLKDRYSIKLITDNDFNLRELNKQFGTRVDNIDVEHLNYEGGKIKVGSNNVLNTDYLKECKDPVLLSLWLVRKVLLIICLFGEKAGLDIKISELISNGALRMRILKEKIRTTEAEVIVNTSGQEITTKRSLVQYIHFPYENESVEKKSKIEKKVYWKITGYNKNEIRNDRLLANSKWTKDKVISTYGVSPEVVYPPISTEEFEKGKSAEERKNGFIIAGRVSREKNIVRSLKILKSVKKRGHQIDVKIVGPNKDDRYFKELSKKIENERWIEYEGMVKRSRLVELFKSYKFGIHGMDEEHFGIVVAEMVSAGIIPFVPNGGGQREIVSENENLLYDTKQDAVYKIDRIIENTELQKEVRISLNKGRKNYSKKSFQKRMLSIIDEELSQ